MSICGNHPRIYTMDFVSCCPIALQNIITMSVELTDNLMVGFLGILPYREYEPTRFNIPPYAGNRWELPCRFGGRYCGKGRKA